MFMNLQKLQKFERTKESLVEDTSQMPVSVTLSALCMTEFGLCEPMFVIVIGVCVCVCVGHVDHRCVCLVKTNYFMTHDKTSSNGGENNILLIVSKKDT